MSLAHFSSEKDLNSQFSDSIEYENALSAYFKSLSKFSTDFKTNVPQIKQYVKEINHFISVMNS